jgi:uncharacterized membrane protein YeiH
MDTPFAEPCGPVLRGELYAVAALAGARVVGGYLLEVPAIVPTIGGAVLCFGIRVVSIRRGWSLPTADPMEPRLPK